MIAGIRYCLALATLACLAFPVAFAADTISVGATPESRQVLDDAEALLASGDSGGAYALLKSNEQTLAGSAMFDYLLGVAALDSGHPNEAIFSLRRALLVSPNFSGARMELARAYYETGNTAMARSLFINLLDENPPPRVRTVITDYIAAIDSVPVAPQSLFLPFIEFAGGYDSNANGSTDDQQFMGFTLSPDNVETDSAFAAAGLGFNWSKQNSSRFGTYAGARLGYRYNPDATFVDAGVISGLAGMNWQRGNFFGRAGLDGYWATRDGEENSSYAGIDALFGRRIATAWDLTLGVRWGALRYADSIEVLDVNRLLYALGTAWRFSPLGSLGFELIGGSDDAQQSSSPYGNSKFGGRLSLAFPVGQSGQFYAAAGSLESDYDGLFFGGPRKDTQLTSLLQIEFFNVITDGLSFIPRFRYVDNDSDVALYDYTRYEIGLLIRWTPQ